MAIESSRMETALLDQRMRADRHKANFESLKAQHLTLQESHQNLRVEFEALSDNYDKLHGKSQEIIHALQSERDTRILENEELKAQVLTGQKLEHLKMQLADEVEEPYRKRLDAVESELETLRSEYTKIKYSYAFLKSEYETATTSHQSVVEELTAKHEAEVVAYIEERKELLARQERNIPSEMQRTRQLQRENSELQQRVKGLTSEVEELQAQKDHAGAQTDKNYQMQSRQLAESQALVKTLEIERSSLTGQVQTLQAELSKANDTQHSLSEQVNHTQREGAALNRKLEESEHRHKMEISELKMHHLHRCRELEEARERSVAEQVSYQELVETLQRALQEQEALLAEKERQVELRVQAVREKEWGQQAMLQREKIELEEKLGEIQRLHAASAEESQHEVERLEDQVRSLHTQKTAVESELELVRTQMKDKSEQHQTLQTELRELRSVNKKYHTMVAEHKSLQHSEQEVRGSCEKLEGRVQLLEEHLARTQEDAQRQHNQHTQGLQRERQGWVAERESLVTRLEECHSQQQTLSAQLSDAKKTSKKLQKHYKKQVRELKLSLEMAGAKEEQLSADKQALKKALELENQKLKCRFSDMQRKQKEFLFLLHHNPNSLTGGVHTPLYAVADQEKSDLDEFEEVGHQSETVALGPHRHPPVSPSESSHSISDRQS